MFLPPIVSGERTEPEQVQLLRTKAGTLLTPGLEETLADEAEAGYNPADFVGERLVGRPSLSVGGGRSRRISIRVDDETYDGIRQLSEELGQPASDLVRRAIRMLLERWKESETVFRV
jgi:hypothetical protein